MACGVGVGLGSYSTGTRDLRCQNSLTIVLYIPPNWSMRHTWFVHSIHEQIATHYMSCIMYIHKKLLFVHDVHQNMLTHYKFT